MYNIYVTPHYYKSITSTFLNKDLKISKETTINEKDAIDLKQSKVIPGKVWKEEMEGEMMNYIITPQFFQIIKVWSMYLVLIIIMFRLQQLFDINLW